MTVSSCLWDMEVVCSRRDENRFLSTSTLHKEYYVLPMNVTILQRRKPSNSNVRKKDKNQVIKCDVPNLVQRTVRLPTWLAALLRST
jgi:hypothetical protein